MRVHVLHMQLSGERKSNFGKSRCNVLIGLYAATEYEAGMKDEGGEMRKNAWKSETKNLEQLDEILLMTDVVKLKSIEHSIFGVLRSLK